MVILTCSHPHHRLGGLATLFLDSWLVISFINKLIAL
jgi:hypothetical protein